MLRGLGLSLEHFNALRALAALEKKPVSAADVVKAVSGRNINVFYARHRLEGEGKTPQEFAEGYVRAFMAPLTLLKLAKKRGGEYELSPHAIDFFAGETQRPVLEDRHDTLVNELIKKNEIGVDEVLSVIGLTRDAIIKGQLPTIRREPLEQRPQAIADEVMQPLVLLKLVEKTENGYALTRRVLRYANKLTKLEARVRKQPRG